MGYYSEYDLEMREGIPSCAVEKLEDLQFRLTDLEDRLATIEEIRPHDPMDIYRVKSVDDAVWNCVRKAPV